MSQCFKCGLDASDGIVFVWDSVQSKWSEFTSYQPSPSTEACNVYCESCWEDWGKHVKPDSKYALSRACEELAIQMGIQFCPDSRSNPFLCPPCNRLFNAGASSLVRHLVQMHNPALQHKDFTPAPLHVSACNNHKQASEEMRGNYIAKGLHHGKPLYQKVCTDVSDVVVFLYFWDSRHGEQHHGWWFSPRKVGSREVLAYNSSQGPDDLTVPTFGWKVPWHGHIDQTLSITMYKDSNARDDTEIELRWQFVVSRDGERENWQPMKKDMNDALERRWTGGWYGDNGTHTFHVESNGFTYAIDCQSMVQWNVSTNRRRRIQRSEAQLDVVSLPKLTAKDAYVERLQSERNSLVEEKSELLAKVAQLEKEKKALESQADHTTKMILQESWRMNRQLQTKVCTELNHWDDAFQKIRQALVNACPVDHYGDCERMRNVRITRLQQICNVRIWKDYEFRKDQIRKELEDRQRVPVVTRALSSQVCPWARLDPKVNEILVVHGTTDDKTDQIANFGFDERLARDFGLYGQGVYFTDQSCKSLQYSGEAEQKVGCFIIARVILGHPYDAPGRLLQTRVEPFVEPSDPSRGRFHSVRVHPGTPRAIGQIQVHREFVIFNGAQAYPEMIVHFTIT